MQYRLPTLFILAALVTATGCGKSDPLAGTWSNSECYGMESTPTDIESCMTTLVFTDALEVTLQSDMISMPATAEFPGCTTSRIVSGQTWSTRPESDFDVLTIEGSPTATMERSGCVNAEDNLDAADTNSIELGSDESNYQVTDGSLTILTGDLEGTYVP